MVVLGGMTRLTRSGLSMTDWKFTGRLPPLTDEDWLVEFEKYKQSPEYKRSVEVAFYASVVQIICCFTFARISHVYNINFLEILVHFMLIFIYLFAAYDILIGYFVSS